MKKVILLFLVPTFFIAQDFRETDKQLHFAAGTVVGALGYHLYNDKHFDQQGAILAGLASGFAAGTAKELFDTVIQGEKFDIEDLSATVLGSFTIAVSIPLFKEERQRFKKRKRRPKNRKRKCGI
jgi:uncharacterized protein YfiM (DUF2279 family)|tara:strand:+ start:429 stop:803 length:375 start_codon:yes stop_codon:yes gene_type:complete